MRFLKEEDLPTILKQIFYNKCIDDNTLKEYIISSICVVDDKICTRIKNEESRQLYSINNRIHIDKAIYNGKVKKVIFNSLKEEF